MSRSRNSTQFHMSERSWKLPSKKESFRDDGDKSLRQKKHGKRYGFTRKCGRLVREQRARFYIMRRCVIMLICWTDHNNNSNSNHS
ncbi:unnamed protein product [Cochlearia groenlandica]